MHDLIAEKIRQGESDEEIRKAVMGNGYSRAFADKLIADTREDLPRMNQVLAQRTLYQESVRAYEVAERRAVRKHEQSQWLVTLIIGLALLALGVAITAGTYWMAGPGGTFYVSGGLIFFGLLAVAKGIYHRIRWW